MCKGERPIGAAKGKQTNTMASSPPPPKPRIRQVWGIGTKKLAPNANTLRFQIPVAYTCNFMPVSSIHFLPVFDTGVCTACHWCISVYFILCSHLHGAPECGIWNGIA